MTRTFHFETSSHVLGTQTVRLRPRKGIVAIRRTGRERGVVVGSSFDAVSCDRSIPVGTRVSFDAESGVEFRSGAETLVLMMREDFRIT